MGRMKDQLFLEPEERGLTDYAVALRGEVDGSDIMCPSPGRPADDRSMCVRVNPDNPSILFVYYCEGGLGAAYAYVRNAIGVIPKAPNPNNIEFAERIWSEAKPAAGTLVERYLRGRGIISPLSADLRFHSALKHSSGQYWPAMVGGLFDDQGHICAVHRTFLRYDGKGKAPVDPDKMTLGPIGGRAIRLGELAPTMVIAEGIETALSAMQLRGTPAFAAMSAVGLKTANLPEQVRHVVIAADGDEFGRAAARAALKRFLREGRTAVIVQAPEGKDFNDVLQERAV